MVDQVARSATPAVSVVGGRLPVGGPVSSGWRECTLTRVKELDTLCAWASANHEERQRRGLCRRHRPAPGGRQGCRRARGSKAQAAASSVPRWGAARPRDEQPRRRRSSTPQFRARQLCHRAIPGAACACATSSHPHRSAAYGIRTHRPPAGRARRRSSNRPPHTPRGSTLPAGNRRRRSNVRLSIRTAARSSRPCAPPARHRFGSRCACAASATSWLSPPCS